MKVKLMTEQKEIGQDAVDDDDRFLK